MVNKKSKPSKKTNSVGAPTKCTPELIKKAEEYLDNYGDHGDMIPSVVGLARVVDVRRETLHVWAAEEGKDKISCILNKIKEEQERVLINKGLDGTFNSNITKLVLGKHDYHDKQDTHVKEFNVTIGPRDADTL